MSNSWHIYHCPPSGEPHLLKTVNTPAQARKNEFYYPSVTGVLGLLPNPFMAKWRGRKMVELSKEHPDKETEELDKLAWGTRTCPATGEEISSSDFGTKAHAAIEDYFVRGYDQDYMPTAYTDIIAPTICYLEKQSTFRYAEKILCCHNLKIAGTVDYIGTDKDGKWMLADFKFRDVKEGSGKAAPFDKDRAQLAIEAEMWKHDLGLDYDPDIYSIIVDVNTGTPHVTKHSEKMRRKGLQLSGVAAYMYWNLPGYGYVENPELCNEGQQAK